MWLSIYAPNQAYDPKVHYLTYPEEDGDYD